MKNLISIFFFLFFSSVCSASESLPGNVVQIIPQGEETIIVINRGSNAGVAVGDKGVFVPQNRPSFKITEVSGFRSKALLNKKSNTLSGLRKVVIQINKE